MLYICFSVYAYNIVIAGIVPLQTLLHADFVFEDIVKFDDLLILS